MYVFRGTLYFKFILYTWAGSLVLKYLFVKLQAIKAYFCFLGRRVNFEIDSRDYAVIQDSNNGNIKYSCNKCSAKVKTLTYLRRHIATKHFNYNSLPCPECSELFCNNSDRKKHILITHKSEGSHEKYVCDKCGKQFAHREGITQHLRGIHTEKKCQKCGTIFQSRYLYLKHLSHKHDRPMPTCGICGFQSVVESRLIVHQRQVHMKEKNISCEYCSLQFFSASQLNSHQIKHSNEKKCVCTVCNKSFRRKSNLNIHMRIHVQDKRKVCTICSQAFVQKSSLNYHMSKHHYI